MQRPNNPSNQDELFKTLISLQKLNDNDLESLNQKKKIKKPRMPFKKWFKIKRKEFIAWLGKTFVPNIVKDIITTTKIKLEERKTIRLFEKKYKTNHNNILNLFNHRLIYEGTYDNSEDMARDLKRSTKKHGYGPKAPKFYDPVIIDIHNELCDEVNKYSLKDLVINEMNADLTALKSQQPSSMNKIYGMVNNTKNFKFKQARDYHKPATLKEEINKIDNIEDTQKNIDLLGKIKETVNFYGRDLTEEQRSELTKKMMTKVHKKEGEILSEAHLILDKEYEGLPSSIKEAMMRPENLLKNNKGKD